jgi:fructose-bisphosphate aldolase class II
MALVNMKDMLEKAKAEKYAVGQFNINNLEWTKTILKVAEEMSSPVILGVSEGAAKYMGGYRTVAGMVKGLLEDMKITVDVALHLDHGSSVEVCKKAIDAGFTSVMIDASHHPLSENIAITKEVVDYAHARGVTVEAELGSIGGQEDDVVGSGIIYADVNECVELSKASGIDSMDLIKPNRNLDSKRWKKSRTRPTSPWSFTEEREFPTSKSDVPSPAEPAR